MLEVAVDGACERGSEADAEDSEFSEGLGGAMGRAGAEAPSASGPQLAGRLASDVSLDAGDWAFNARESRTDLAVQNCQ